MNVKKLTSKKGFTLIELLLSVALIGILVGFSVPVFRGVKDRNDIDTTANIIVHNLRRAQTLSQAVDEDINWGVNLTNTVITLFKGINYANRDSNYDEIFDVANTVKLSGDTEIFFTKFSGELNSNKNIILTSSDGSEKNITINQKGIIEY